jgi:O-antigen/teichoic acid export membrane protein
VLLNSFNCVQIGILAGLGNFKQVSFINILKGTTSGLLMVILVYPYDLLGAVVGLAIGSGASCLLATIFINKVMTPLYKANIGNSIVFKLKDFSGIAIPSILSSLITIPVMMLANTKLATGENGLKEMGIFNIAFQWRTIMIFVPTYLNFVFLSHLSTSFYSNLKRFKQLLILNFGATLLLCSFFLLIIIFFKSQIEFIYIVDFRGVSDVILLLSISALFTAIASVLGNLFAATTKMWYGFIPNALWTLVFLYLLNTSEKIDALELSYIYMKSYLLLVISASIFASILYFNMRKTLLK